MLSRLNRWQNLTWMRHGHFRVVTRSASVFNRIADKLKRKSNESEANVEKGKSLMMESAELEKYKLIYGFHSTKYYAAFIKLQKPLVLCTVVLVPLSHLFDKSGAVALSILFFSFNQFLVMRILGWLVKDLVGAIYVNKTGEVKEVVVSSLTRNGKRVDRVHDAKEVLNYGYPHNYAKALGFVQLTVEGDLINYKLNVRNYKVYDKKAFGCVVGDVL